jgi:hypothetical protein
MPALTRRRYPERPDCWHVYYGDVHLGTIARRRRSIRRRPVGMGCGFYPGSPPGEHLYDTAATSTRRAPTSLRHGGTLRPGAPRRTTRNGEMPGIGPRESMPCGRPASCCRRRSRALRCAAPAAKRSIATTRPEATFTGGTSMPPKLPTGFAADELHSLRGLWLGLREPPSQTVGRCPCLRLRRCRRAVSMV